MEKSSIFDKTKYFIIDMDGTFYLGGNIIPGAPDFITRLRETGRDFYFFTNNSSNNVEVCRAKLAKMGFPVDEQRVIISSHVAADYLNRNYAGKRVYLLGNERLTADLAAAGINLVEDEPDIVLLGFDTTLTYEKLRKAVKFIDGGATYIATHPDVNCPTEDGYMPDTGSMIELFAASTGKRPLVLGKPMTATGRLHHLDALLRQERAGVHRRQAGDGYRHRRKSRHSLRPCLQRRHHPRGICEIRYKGKRCR